MAHAKKRPTRSARLYDFVAFAQQRDAMRAIVYGTCTACGWYGAVSVPHSAPWPLECVDCGARAVIRDTELDVQRAHH